MKVAVLAESPFDQRFVYILANAVAGGRLARADLPIEARGWPHLADTALPAAIATLHFRFPEIRALIVVADTDHTEPHVADHAPSKPPRRCRWCRLSHAADQALNRLRPNPAREAPLHVIVSVAEPCVEHWLLCGTGAQYTEPAWRRMLRENPMRAKDFAQKQLKQRKYGTTRAGRSHYETDGLANAQRVAKRIGELEQAFPTGFGLLARQLRELLESRP